MGANLGRDLVTQNSKPRMRQQLAVALGHVPQNLSHGLWVHGDGGIFACIHETRPVVLLVGLRSGTLALVLVLASVLPMALALVSLAGAFVFND